MNEIQRFRNFNLGTEISIAGSFAYNAISNLNNSQNISEDDQIFLFLYNGAVSVERIQKCVLFMYADLKAEEINPFADKMKIHRHQELQNRINSLTGLKLSQDQNAFLLLLQNFYAIGRYSNFENDSDYCYVQKLKEFVAERFGASMLTPDFLGKKLLISEKAKERLGRTLGKILRSYYKLIRDKARDLNLYTYELRPGSQAEKVFYNQDPNASLQALLQKDKIALLELIVYLSNNKETTGFFQYLRSIPCLEFDPGMVQEYIADVINNQLSQALVDEVITLYEDMPSGMVQERKDSLSPLSDPHCIFDFDDDDEDEQCNRNVHGALQ